MVKHSVSMAILAGFLAAAACAQDAPVPAGALARMPVKEITVFKDGHAYVLHEGELPTDARGSEWSWSNEEAQRAFTAGCVLFGRRVGEVKSRDAAAIDALLPSSTALGLSRK